MQNIAIVGRLPGTKGAKLPVHRYKPKRERLDAVAELMRRQNEGNIRRRAAAVSGWRKRRAK